MTQQLKHIAKRLREIEQELTALEVERSMLRKTQHGFSKWPHLIKEGDKFSQRTSVKFELLAKVADYLSEADPLVYGGASTKEIYHAVVEKTKVEGKRREWFNSDPGRLEDGIDRDVGTPLSNSREPINYNTFRSYLARYKAEGRLFYNDDTRRWRVSPEDLSSNG
ncbi:hypothetical protein [uncultured Roseobacter sp.]|uniref:hypothetical protein n=1 Tax=uncultured Roseobacter sp. TaxID=114847 RepID=UPI00260C0950|nr:hypothetical protein [uncultured Roseobacter sp.]